MLQRVQGGKWSFGRDVILQIVQGGKGVVRERLGVIYNGRGKGLVRVISDV